jgi:ubiquinone/menaquinone biosynthesis C-methylase UbiE
MEMRDFSNLPGIAQPKSSGAMDEHSRAEQNRTSDVSFAKPENIVQEIGLNAGMKIADFGAGSGAYSFAMSPIVSSQGRIYSIEVQQELLKKIKNTADSLGIRNIDTIWGDFERPNGSKLAENFVDAVIISNTLFQLDDQRGALLEANRILRPGGHLIIIDWSESFGGMGPQKKDVISKDKANEMCISAGFDFSRSFNAGSYHYGLIFNKPTVKNSKAS